MDELLLLGISYFAYAILTTVILIWLIPNQSNRRSAVQCSLLFRFNVLREIFTVDGIRTRASCIVLFIEAWLRQLALLANIEDFKFYLLLTKQT